MQDHIQISRETAHLAMLNSTSILTKNGPNMSTECSVTTDTVLPCNHDHPKLKQFSSKLKLSFVSRDALSDEESEYGLGFDFRPCLR